MTDSVRRRSSDIQPRSSTSAKVWSGAAGAGTGTLLVALARNLPDDHPWKPWLVLLAPSLTVAIGALYSWAREGIEQYRNSRQLARLVHQAKQTVREALGNPLTTGEHRNQLQKELEALELLLVRTDLDRIRVLAKR